MPNFPVGNILWHKNLDADLPHSLTNAAGWLWAGSQPPNSQPGVLARINPANGNLQDIVFPNDGIHQWIMDSLYIPSKNRVYCLFGGNNRPDWTVVSEINPSNRSVVDVIVTNAFRSHQGSFCVNNGYMFIACYTGFILKYRLSDWSFQGSISSPHLWHSIRFDTETNRLFATSSDAASGVNIIRIDPDNFVIEQTAAVSDTLLCDDFTFTDGYIWVGSELTANLIRISKTDITNQSLIVTGSPAACYGTYFDGHWVWAVFGMSPGKMIQLDPRDSTFETWDLPTGYNLPNEIASDTIPATTLYITHYDTPGAVTALSLAGFLYPPKFIVSDSLAFSDAVAARLDAGPAISNIAIHAADRITFTDFQSGYFPFGFRASDTLAFTDHISTHRGNIIVIVPPPEPEPSTPPEEKIFEFYALEAPEDVEILPIPRRLDQLGPMRFDKIGKLFGFRVRLIVNGETAAMPYAIYGDDADISPAIGAALWSGTFPVLPGIDEVYEIQLPKSVNSDIFRIVLGPTTDTFHRYDLLAKVHVSGMAGQAKWVTVK